MDNRDFRDRLREHQVEPSMPAWEQMEGMLDAIPGEKKGLKKRTIWWPFFLVGLLAAVLIPIAIQDKERSDLTEATNADLQKVTTEKLSTTLTTSEKASENSAPSANQVVAQKNSQAEKTKRADKSTDQTQKQSLRNSAQSSTAAANNTTAKEQYMNTSRATSETNLAQNINNSSTTFSSTRQETSYESESSGRNLGLGKRSQQKDIPLDKQNEFATTEDGSSSVSANESSIDQATMTPTNGQLSTAEKATILTGAERTLTNDEKDTALTATESASETKDPLATENARWTESLEYLNKDFDLLKYDAYDMGQTKQIRHIGPTRFFWLLGAGYAEFNNNPGMIFSAGILYDVDRIIDLELNTSYTFGRGPSIAGTDLTTAEQQLDLNLMIHLNFIKTKRHKISFDVGGGLTSYSGKRVITSAEPYHDIRSSLGRNLQMAFSYHYSLSRDSKLGVRLGVISYDDAVVYISSRYVQRF